MFDKSQLKPRNEYLYLFGVGGLFLFAITQTIIAPTVISPTPFRLYMMGLACLLVITGVLFNRVTRIAAAVLVAVVALFILLRPELREAAFIHFHEVFLVATGYIRQPEPAQARTLLLLILLALGFTTVVFILHRFSFSLLATCGIIIIALSWLSAENTRHILSFSVFIFVFILLFVRKMSGRVDTAAMAAPLAILVIFLANFYTPAYSEAFTRRTMRDAFEGRFMAIEDFLFELFNPMYFSFTQTGFSGTGGRLGGPITPNNSPVMEVSAPGMTYLSGATHNYFTGYAWRTTLQAGDIYTHGLHPGHFEMLETASALIHSANFARAGAGLNTGTLRLHFPDEMTHNLNTNHFVAMRIGVEAQFLPGIFSLEAITGFLRLREELPDTWQEFMPPEIDWAYIDWAAQWMYEHGTPGVTVPLPDNYGVVRYYRHIYLPMETVSIALGRNRTGSIFRPPSSRQLWFDGHSFNYAPLATISPMGDMRAPGFMRRGTIYHHHFLHVNPNMGLVRDILQGSYAGLYAARGAQFYPLAEEIMQSFLQEGETLAQALADRDIMTPQLADDVFNYLMTGNAQHVFFSITQANMELLSYGFALDVLAAYAASVRAHFLQVPDITPARVHDLTHHLIRYEETDFGRVMAIRDFLIANFPYTMSPVPVPRGVCFVDHFLFDGQEGYCTYFATAMAVMARIAGIPTRYVEGFVVPGESRNIHTISQVTNRMAHAWVEVYLEGFGWLIIEATPPYAAAAAAIGALPIPLAGPFGYDPWRDWEQYIDMNFMPGGPPMAWAGGGGGAAVEEAPTWSIQLYALVFFSGLLALAIISAALFFLSGWLRFRMALRRVAQLDTKTRTQAYFKGILSISEYYHLHLHEDETTLAYSRRAGKRFAYRSDSIFLRDLITLYNRAKYSARPITEQDAALMQEGYFDMLALFKRMRPRQFAYLFYVKKVGAV